MSPHKRVFQTMVFLLAAGVSAETAPDKIVTAAAFFSQVSAQYGTVKDFEASLTVTTGTKGGESVQKGKIFFKSPVYLRIDFSAPAGQVVVTDGEKLTVYTPNPKTVLVQRYDKKTTAQLTELAGSRALSYLQEDYLIAFESLPEYTPLEEGSKEQVMKLLLKGANQSATYRQITLSISRDLMIRRMECETNGNGKLTLDYQNIRVNQNIPDSRFDYDGPPDAAVINNFLYESE